MPSSPVGGGVLLDVGRAGGLAGLDDVAVATDLLKGGLHPLLGVDGVELGLGNIVDQGEALVTAGHEHLADSTGASLGLLLVRIDLLVGGVHADLRPRPIRSAPHAQLVPHPSQENLRLKKGRGGAHLEAVDVASRLHHLGGEELEAAEVGAARELDTLLATLQQKTNTLWSAWMGNQRTRLRDKAAPGPHALPQDVRKSAQSSARFTRTISCAVRSTHLLRALGDLLSVSHRS